MSKTAIIIPARYGSKRLQGKPLLKVCNKPIIQWVWEKAIQVKSADMVIIATDNQEIYDCAKAFGANVEMTSENHKCGSDRIVEVAIITISADLTWIARSQTHWMIGLSHTFKRGLPCNLFEPYLAGIIIAVFDILVLLFDDKSNPLFLSHFLD